MQVRDNGGGLQVRHAEGAAHRRRPVEHARRLDCLYGRHYRLEFSDRDGGLSVLIEIPFQRVAAPGGAAGARSAWHEHHDTLHRDSRPDRRRRTARARAAPHAAQRRARLRDRRRGRRRHRRRRRRSSRSIPDLVFLDVQMPGADGFDVIDAVGADKMPFVVFVTAYDRYALRAFDVHALDYLLKPFDRERFRQALTRAQPAARRSSNGGEIEQPPRRHRQRPAPGQGASTDRFVVKSGGRIFFVRTAEIDWIEAAGNYVKLHVGNDSHLIRETMNAVEAKLSPETVRPHPPLPHRQHRAGARAAALVQRRVRRVPEERHAPDPQPRLPRAAAGAGSAARFRSLGFGSHRAYNGWRRVQPRTVPARSSSIARATASGARRAAARPDAEAARPAPPSPRPRRRARDEGSAARRAVARRQRHRERAGAGRLRAARGARRRAGVAAATSRPSRGAATGSSRR